MKLIEDQEKKLGYDCPKNIFYLTLENKIAFTN